MELLQVGGAEPRPPGFGSSGSPCRRCHRRRWCSWPARRRGGGRRPQESPAAPGAVAAGSQPLDKLTLTLVASKGLNFIIKDCVNRLLKKNGGG
uniref:Uncharacterized protein n=1 Tax=Oryza meridionalis TaxID=40149 RepID=A0A0E0DMD5_9ORYZ